MDTIAVCVCTFQREALLEACLSSVAAMALPASTAVHVVVIVVDVLAAVVSLEFAVAVAIGLR